MGKAYECDSSETSYSYSFSKKSLGVQNTINKKLFTITPSWTMKIKCSMLKIKFVNYKIFGNYNLRYELTTSYYLQFHWRYIIANLPFPTSIYNNLINHLHKS